MRKAPEGLRSALAFSLLCWLADKNGISTNSSTPDKEEQSEGTGR